MSRRSSSDCYASAMIIMNEINGLSVKAFNNAVALFIEGAEQHDNLCLQRIKEILRESSYFLRLYLTNAKKIVDLFQIEDEMKKIDASRRSGRGVFGVVDRVPVNRSAAMTFQTESHLHLRNRVEKDVSLEIAEKILKICKKYPLEVRLECLKREDNRKSVENPSPLPSKVPAPVYSLVRYCRPVSEHASFPNSLHMKSVMIENVVIPVGTPKQAFIAVCRRFIENGVLTCGKVNVWNEKWLTIDKHVSGAVEITGGIYYVPTKKWRVYFERIVSLLNFLGYAPRNSTVEYDVAQVT